MNGNDSMNTKSYPAVCPLTVVQKGIYIQCVSEPEKLTYNLVMLLRLPRTIDEARFISSVREAAGLHKALFVRIASPEGVPSMLYGGESTADIAVKDVESIEREVRAFTRPFDIENEPLYRFEYLRSPEGPAFLFDIHHIICDGTSINAFMREIQTVYAGGSCPEEDRTIFDLAVSEKGIEDSAQYREAREFFNERLGAADCDSKPVPDVMTADKPQGKTVLDRRIDGLLPSEVREFAKTAGVSENALFLGAFSYALARFNGNDECYFSTAHHGRIDKAYKSSMGIFARTLPLYRKIDETRPVKEFLAQVYDDYYQTRLHACLPFSDMIRDYGASMDVVFAFEGKMFDELDFDGFKTRLVKQDVGEDPADLNVMVMDEGDAYKVVTVYNRALYTRELISSLVKLFENTAKSMLTAGTLGDIALTDAEDIRAWAKINDTAVPYDRTKTVLDLFRARAAETPDALCLVRGETRLSYAEVDRRTDLMAKYLIEAGIGKEKIAGIMIPRTEYMVLCALAVLKAGGAYMPLDLSYPPERLNLMMKDSAAVLLITDEEHSGIITEEFSGRRVLLSELEKLPDRDTVLPVPAPGDMFMILYTSGSTGVPKGVMYEHSNMLTTSLWQRDYYALDTSSRVTFYASFGFDAHSYDIYAALISGAALFVIPEDMRLDFLALREYFNLNGITDTTMTTQIGRQFAEMGGLKTLRNLSVGGEKLTPIAPPSGFTMHNVYGPTECSVITSAFRLDQMYSDVPVGRAVSNLKTYVVDPRGRLLPPGASGELWVAGPHVTRGYLNRPEKNREAYGLNPFENIPGYERIYRTGDIVRMRADGNLQFIGRRDAQVKVRGFRIELTEVEEIVRRFPGITDATVKAFDAPSGGKFIAAYVVAGAPVDIGALNAFIRERKPPYIVPEVTMQLDKIPLNQNGKVNKRALPEPQRRAADLTPPETGTQKRIFDICAGVLGHSGFGIDTNLFEAGLTSIGSVRLTVALGDGFNAAVRIRDIKQNSTVRLLESFLAGAASAEKTEVMCDYPITQTQLGIYTECLMNPGATMYNIPLLLKIEGGLDSERLVKAVAKAINAHPYLKTTLFADSQGNPRAKRNDSLEPAVKLISGEPNLEKLVRPFELTGSPLYRAEVYAAKENTYLYLEIHHIICDGTSEKLLLDDIDRAYRGEEIETETRGGFEMGLEEETARSGGALEKAKAYYASLLEGAETECLPFKAPEKDQSGIGEYSLFVPFDMEKLAAFCAENELTPGALFNAAFGYTLKTFNAAEEAVYTTVYNGRSDSRFARSVSMLVKTIPVRVNPAPEMPVKDYVRALGSQMMDSMVNDIYSFAEISRAFGVKADVMFVWQGDSFTFDSLCGEKAELIKLSASAAKAPFALTAAVEQGGLRFDAEYRPDMYSGAFASSFINALASAAECFTRGGRLSDVQFMFEGAEEIYAEMNSVSAPFENEPVFRAIERWAKVKPSETAVVAAGERLTFSELNARANRVAHALSKLGVEEDTIIGLLLDRGVYVFIGEFGIMKAGGAFLPMLKEYPDDRLDYCLQNASSPYVLTTRDIINEKQFLFTPDKSYRALAIEDLLSETDETDPAAQPGADKLAYCIYTSGSTGLPKGVMIEHHSLANFAQNFGRTVKWVNDPACTGLSLCMGSISFDMSVSETMPVLRMGKGVCMATEEEVHAPLKLAALMKDNNVEMMTCTPSFMVNMLSIPEFAAAVKGIKSIVVAAEAFPGPLYDALKQISPDMMIINGYGPTECTVCTSMKVLTGSADITIGTPIANAKIYVTDTLGRVLPQYALGELTICGEIVSRGYIKLPERNAKSFCTLRGLRAYHSGDLVRLTAQGEISFCGRVDNMVKIRGFRVELDEIEKVMCLYPGVNSSKVVVRSNGSEEYLAGFFTASDKVNPEALTEHLKSKLTYYMVPAALMQLEAMPLNTNGKIDKKRLPEVTRLQRKGKKRSPKKSMEEKLCELFKSVLNLEECCADDNFFELGGTSLSASKVTMRLMSDGIQVEYGDIFANPTPEELAEFIEGRRAEGVKAEKTAEAPEEQNEALKYNCMRYAPEIRAEKLGTVLLTGATGFLGIHVLRELIDRDEGDIVCLVRKGNYDSASERLKSMLMYYFDDPFEAAVRDRIRIAEADITDENLSEKLSGIHFDTVINCAACVKHFSADDSLNRINVGGVENLIKLCMERGAKLVQISTTSVPGVHTEESYERHVKMFENQLFMVDSMDNKYAISKYTAETKILEAVKNGLRGKIVRVGNLMGRHSDGEFQINSNTNMFISGLRGFAALGIFPISHITDPMRFSPVDMTARAVVLLASANDMFTAFNADARYGFDEMKIVDALNENGITIKPVDDKVYYDTFRAALADDRLNALLNGLAAYDKPGVHSVETDNSFTVNALYRLGFAWPMTDERYLSRVVDGLKTIGYFDDILPDA